MAFPTTITTGGDTVRGDGRPYLSSGGNVYVIVRDDVTLSKFRAFKATDPAVSFSNVGTDPDATNTIVAISTYQVSDDIHVVTMDNPSGATYNIKYHIFSMSSDSWTTTNEAVVTSFVTVFAVLAHISISVRSTGDVIVLYNGAKVANMGSDRDRVYYARRVSAVWTIDVVVDNGGATSWYSDEIIRGSSDRMHLYFADDGADDAYQRCLRSANTLEAFPASYDATIGATVTDNTPTTGISYVSGAATKVRHPYYDSTANTINAALCDSADTPTMSISTDITGATNANVLSNRSSFNAEGTNLWHAFFDTGADIFTQSNANDAGWSAPALLQATASTTVTIFTNVYVRNGDTVLAIVYFDTGDPKYTEKVLVAASNKFVMNSTATLTDSGKSTAADPFTQAAVASLTASGAATAADPFSQAAVASLTASGTATAADPFSQAAVASLTASGTATAADPFSQAAVASLTASGAATAADPFTQAATASLTMEGATTSQIAAAAFNSSALATLSADAISTNSGSATAAVVASLTMEGVAVGVGAKKNLDGWKPKRQQRIVFGEIEDEDILFMAGAFIAYMEQNRDCY